MIKSMVIVNESSIIKRKLKIKEIKFSIHFEFVGFVFGGDEFTYVGMGGGTGGAAE